MKNTLLALSVCFSALMLSQPVFAIVDISLSPGDSYLARIPNFEINWSKKSERSVIFYACGGLTNSCSANDNHLVQQKDGINYEITEGKLIYSLNGFKFWNSANGEDSCGGFPPYGGYSAYCAGRRLSMGYIRSPDYGAVNLNADISLQEIKISAPASIKPGIYEKGIYLNVSTISGVWEVKKRDVLRVHVKDNTCTIQNSIIDMGHIQIGEIKREKVNLNLSCSHEVEPQGTSWKYTNLNYKTDNNTNLKNVFLKLKNSKGEVVDDDFLYQGIDDLNDLSIEVEAKNNAQSGKLNVPLKFTLIYS